MTFESAIAFLFFSVVAAVTPGPSNVMLTAAGASLGVMRGLPCLFGVVAGMGTLFFGVTLGLGSAALVHPILLRTMNWVGAAFLIWLSWKIGSSKEGVRGTNTKPIGFLNAAAFQWINPKSWLVTTAAVGAYMPSDTHNTIFQANLFASLFMLAALPSGFTWLVFGASIKRLILKPEHMRYFNIAMGVTLAASVAFILW